MENKLDLILSEIKNMNTRMSTMESNIVKKQDFEKVSIKVEGIKGQVAYAQEDITAIKTTLFLNKCLFQVVSTLERITNQ